jgi:transcriptional regulator with XRE-family HTH domain
MDSPEDFKRNLAVKVLKLRRERQLTQAELAELCDIPQPVLSLYEKEESTRMPTLYGIVKLANALEVSVDYLLGRTKDRQGLKKSETEEALLRNLSAKDRKILMHVAEGLLAVAKTKQQISMRRKTGDAPASDAL